ncbi:MAG TPA: alanine racemase, partial [Saprospiraceae bacterium]|nr:alanine racemase [Saprospiraceae bacterium]
MAFLTLDHAKLKHNYQFLDQLFRETGTDWAVVTKLLCGNEAYLREVLKLGVKEVCDSRASNLAKIKAINPEVQTVYIKPPAPGAIEAVVRYADVSFNSESSTIRMLSEEAQRQKKIHKVTIMIELGDLREGIMGDNLIGFYKKVFELPNIEVVAIGANLNCLHGVMPSEDKLIQLSLYKQLIEATFHKNIPWITGGTSVVLPLLMRRQVPIAINHFR